MNAVVKPGAAGDFKIADISLADWGRKEMNIAEGEMPGLMPSARNTRPRSRCAARASPVPCT